MSRHTSLAITAFLVFLTGSAAGCGDNSVEHVETTAAVPVSVETAKIDTILEKVVASGLIAAAPGGELTIVAPEAGRIAEMPHSEGEPVKAGDLLVRFEIPTLASDLAAKRAAVTQASARLDAATANLNRLSSLLTQGVAARREVEDAKRAEAEAAADLEQAKSGVDAAMSLSARTTVHATFSGVVAKRFHNPGDFVEPSASDPVLKVINPASLQVVAAVPAAQIPRVVVGHAAEIRVAGGEEREAARVLTKAVQVDPASGTGDVRLAFTKPTALAVGTAVEVEIVGEEHKSALVIPAAAIVSEEGEIFVMVAGPDNKAHKYPIATGLSTRTVVEVTSGLKAGERVIVRGQEELPEGAAVRVEGQ